MDKEQERFKKERCKAKAKKERNREKLKESRWKEWEETIKKEGEY